MLSMITSYINVIFINIKNIRNNNIYLYCIRIVLFNTVLYSNIRNVKVCNNNNFFY